MNSQRTKGPSKSQPRRRPTRRRISRNPVQVHTGHQAFPKQLFNTLTYSDQAVMTVSAGYGKYVFSCNGMFDPNITGTGHQPLYFDQLMAVYDHYTVLRSRIKVTYAAPSGGLVPMLCSLYIDDDTSTVADALIASERPDASSAFYVPSSMAAPILRNSWDAAAVFGPNPQAQDSLQGTSSTNPSEQSYYITQIYDASLATTSVNIFVQIEFDVVWDEFVTVAVS